MEVRFHFELAVPGGHAPENGLWAMSVLGDFFVFDAGELFEQRTMLHEHAFHVGDKYGGRNLRAEEELEEHFVAWYFRLRRYNEPRI